VSAARIDPDTRPVVLATVALVASLGLVSFTVSFAGLSAVAEWAALPNNLRWAVPVFVDGALLAYTLAVLVQRARGESATFSWTALAAFTAVSVAANAAHVLGVGDPGDWRTYAGAGIAAISPLGVFAATHTLASLAIERPARPDTTQLTGPTVPPVADVVEPDQDDVPLDDVVVPDTVPELLLPRDTARMLRDTYDLSLRDIADRMEVSKSTVERWLGQARREPART